MSFPMHARVVNATKAPRGAWLYVGRPSEWGNPFTIAEHGERALDLFFAYLEADPKGILLAGRAPLFLAGKTLGCPCAGRYPVCHAEVWARLADGEALAAIRDDMRARLAAVNTRAPRAKPSAPALEPILAISLWQPWASLMAVRAKRLETRGWAWPRSASSRAIAIHAAQSCDLEVLKRPEVLRALVDGGALWPEIVHAPDVVLRDALPRGAIVALGETQSCYKITDDFLASPYMRAEELPFGDFTKGRFAWDLGIVQPLPQPIPARGFQKIWEWTPPMPLWDLAPEAFARSSVRCPGCARLLGGAIAFEPHKHPGWGCDCGPGCSCVSCDEARHARDEDRDPLDDEELYDDGDHLEGE